MPERDKVRRMLPDSDLVRGIWSSIRDLGDVHGVLEEAMANTMPKIWRGRVFRAGDQHASGQSVSGVLLAHNAETISSSKAQHRLGKLVDRVRFEKYVASLDQLPETTPQRGTGDPQGEKEMRGLAKVRQRN